MDTWTLVAKVLHRFNKQQLIGNVLQLDIFGSELDRLADKAVSDSIPKDILIDEFLRCLQRSRTTATIVLTELTLLLVYLHSNSRLWSMYKLRRITFDFVNNWSESPKEISAKLQDFLSRQTRLRRISVATQIRNGYYWILIRHQLRAAFASCFAVYSQGSHYMACSGFTNRTMNEQIFHHLGRTVGFRGAQLTNLKDRNINAMFQLVAKADDPNVAPWNIQLPGVIRHLTVDENHRPQAQPDEVLDEHFMDANVEEKTKDNKLVTELYSAHPPALTIVKANIKTPFAGRAFAPNMDDGDDFQISVVIEGPNVLEGIQQMVQNGIMRCPLPDKLAQIRLDAQNTFDITD